MEGCPRLASIAFDLKTSIENVNLCEKIPNFIAANYHENADQYRNECEQINRLRQNAINATTDESGLSTLKRYFCQLQLLRNRFPMYSEGECAVKFTWEDAFQKEDNTFNDIRFEEASILYNIGAMYSRLAANENRRTAESAKTACTYFRHAAGCFEKVRDQYTPYTSDMTADLLTCQIQILLGQAHETVLEKALLDQRPSAIATQLAMQISENNQLAILNLTKNGISSIVSKRYREWRVILTYKLSFYFGLSHFFSGLVSEEAKKRGQAVCFYQSAVDRLNEAWKTAEKISSDKTSMFKDVHQFTSDVFNGKFKATKRDNDSVYFEKVPILSSLPAVQGVTVAKSQFFDCHDPEVSGVDIFQKLVPLDAHLAASEYSEEKAKLLREIVELTENKNRELETFLRCLQLDRVPLNNEYLRLPRDLLDCCAAAAARPTMIKDLVSAMRELNSQHHDVLEEINDFDEALRTIDEAKELKMNLKQISEMMSQANENNVELHRRMSTIIEHMKILHGPLEQLEKTLPIIDEIDDENNKTKFARLALLNEKIETMKKQREMLINDFRRKIQDDDITKLVLMQRQENHQSLFSDQVKKHEELVNIIKQNCLAQDNILQAVTDANAEIAEIRMKIGTTFENRNRIIQDYINSFKDFEGILAKANEGIEFYKKQSAKLIKLKERLTTLQAQQPVPTPPPPKVSSIPSRFNSKSFDLVEENYSLPEIPTSTISDRPRLKDYLAAMKPESWGSNPTSRASKRSSTKIEETMYLPPSPSVPMDSNSFYPSSTRSSLTPFSSSMHSDPPAMSYNFPPTRFASPSSDMNSTQRNSQTFYPPAAPTQPQQHFYPPPPPQQQQQYFPSVQQPQNHLPAAPPQPQSYQPVQPQNYQPQPPQQPQNHLPAAPPPPQTYQPVQPQNYQPQPPQQPQNHLPAAPPQPQTYQPVQPQNYQPQPQTYQSVQPPQHQNYQPPTIYQQQQQPMIPPASFPSQPTMQYQQPAYPPSTHQQSYQHPSVATPISAGPTVEPIRPSLPTKYDPYRPQPLGTYDIPKAVPSPPRLNPQDIYRPGGLLMMPNQPMNNNNNNNNHYQTTFPAAPVLTPTVAPPPTKPSTITISEDLLSLALEQHVENNPMKVEPLQPQPCYTGQFDRR